MRLMLEHVAGPYDARIYAREKEHVDTSQTTIDNLIDSLQSVALRICRLSYIESFLSK